MARHYTKREKVTTVIAAELTSNLAAERATGVPESSIRRWRDDPELAKYLDKTREELADGAQMMAHRALEKISASLDRFEPKDLVTLFGVMVDKTQLLSGGATARTEARDITGTISDAELTAAILEAEQVLTGRGGPPPSEGTPEG